MDAGGNDIDVGACPNNRAPLNRRGAARHPHTLAKLLLSLAIPGILAK